MTDATIVTDLNEAEKLSQNNGWSFDAPEWEQTSHGRVKTWRFYNFRNMGKFYKERIVDGQGRETYITKENEGK